MKKSKHYRKDVILARVIAALILILLIAIISLAVSLLTKPSNDGKDTQNTQNTQDVNQGYDESENSEESENTEDVETTEDVDASESETSESEPNVDSESEGDAEEVYVQTTTQVKLRKEPNTTCATLDRIDGGTKLLVLESLDGWYKVTYNGQTGYVSADYAKVVEE